MPASLTDALAQAERGLSDVIESLERLARIGGVSAKPPPNAELADSAAAVADWMRRAGLEHVEVIEMEGVHPYVYGDWLQLPGAPTVILYAHHDVQPPGRASHWVSPPYEPEERDGRLYGRGVVDDKAGVAVHLAAIESYLSTGGLPLNVRVVIDGEEETGSENLVRFLEEQRDRLQADVIILTDTSNHAAGLPSITYALRGIVVVDLTVEALDHPLHSGMWGGPAPDAPLAMCKLLAGLLDAEGRITVPGIYDAVQPLDDEGRQRIAALPYDEAELRADAGILEGVALSGEPDFTPYELMWHRPSLAISALEAAPLEGASNQIVSSARARIGIRTVPNMDARQVAQQLCQHLESDPPWNVRVSTEIQAAAKWWFTDPRGQAFDAAERALERGFGCKSVYIGCGGSIPFVEPFAVALGNAPALLIGLEDPACNAHSENESLLLSDFFKAINSSIWLYHELGQLKW